VTDPRDPVQDMIRYAEAVGGRLARASYRGPTWWTVLRWAIVAFIIGFASGLGAIFGWANAHAKVPTVAEQYRRDLTRIAQSVWGMDAPVPMLAAQIQQESAWRPGAVSPVGAQGLTQFMPATARDVGSRYIAGPVSAFDPRWAMQAQSFYMRDLARKFGHARNECERIAFALAAYNGGARWVQRRMAASPDPTRCLGLTCEINPGITAANQRENAHYPRRILLRYEPAYVAAMWGRATCGSYTGS
jgi:soluble lytic murein transglycosylase-like protein